MTACEQAINASNDVHSRKYHSTINIKTKQRVDKKVDLTKSLNTNIKLSIDEQKISCLRNKKKYRGKTKKVKITLQKSLPL